jgi:hypothetical protein
MGCTNYLQSRNSRVRRGVPEKHGKYDVILSKETGLLDHTLSSILNHAKVKLDQMQNTSPLDGNAQSGSMKRVH